jgi:hypothetical protein
LGGNLFYLKFFGSSSQLHRVWDSELIKRYQEQEGIDWKQFSSELIEILQDNPQTLKSYVKH